MQSPKIIKVFDVEYTHLKLEKEADIYFTKRGLPFIENLMPENFITDRRWYKENSRRLSGTACLYKVRTKKVNDKFKDIIVKWNRMGQEIPGAGDCNELMHAEFNSPFEEFSLVEELKDAICKSPAKITIQNPLAIYVPSEYVELSQTGRKIYKIKSKINEHKDIELDMFRLYAVIYDWIEGIDATEAFEKGIINEKCMEILTLDSREKLEKEGFQVKDSKPHHIIVMPQKNGNLARDKDGKIIYGLVDFELLTRTPQREEIIKYTKRRDYLKRQSDRFKAKIPLINYPHLSYVNIMGVNYVYGHVESTKGRLWIVGNDPHLFDYFLPERWKETPRTKVSVFREMYYTVTKDKIHLVWKVSRVGLLPDKDPFKEEEYRIVEHGYNSPFEEIAISMKLNHKGLATTYPRAIYMSGYKTKISNNLLDNSRYDSHKDIKTPDELPILQKNRDYVIIYGYWNGPDEKLAKEDSGHYEGINALNAYRMGIITHNQYMDLMKIAKTKLLQTGFEDLNLRGRHLIISLDSQDKLVTDSQGSAEMRICNLEYLKEI